MQLGRRQHQRETQVPEKTAGDQRQPASLRPWCPSLASSSAFALASSSASGQAAADSSVRVAAEYTSQALYHLVVASAASDLPSCHAALLGTGNAQDHRKAGWLHDCRPRRQMLRNCSWLSLLVSSTVLLAYVLQIQRFALAQLQELTLQMGWPGWDCQGCLLLRRLVALRMRQLPV